MSVTPEEMALIAVAISRNIEAAVQVREDVQESFEAGRSAATTRMRAAARRLRGDMSYANDKLIQKQKETLNAYEQAVEVYRSSVASLNQATDALKMAAREMVTAQKAVEARVDALTNSVISLQVRAVGMAQQPASAGVAVTRPIQLRDLTEGDPTDDVTIEP